MNVHQLIQALERIENKDKEIEVAIRQVNKAHVVEFAPIHNDEWLNQACGKVRIYATLPEGSGVTKRRIR